MIIDATNLVLGRMSAYAAKKALLGETVDIVNCESAVVTGKKDVVLRRYLQKADRGIPLQGPYFPRHPEGLVRRTVRGMLPYKQFKGREALKRVKCFVGVPAEFADKKAVTVKTADVDNAATIDFVSVKVICSLLRGRR